MTPLTDADVECRHGTGQRGAAYLTASATHADHGSTTGGRLTMDWREYITVDRRTSATGRPASRGPASWPASSSTTSPRA